MALPAIRIRGPNAQPPPPPSPITEVGTTPWNSSASKHHVRSSQRTGTGRQTMHTAGRPGKADSERLTQKGRLGKADSERPTRVAGQRASLGTGPTSADLCRSGEQGAPTGRSARQTGGRARAVLRETRSMGARSSPIAEASPAVPGGAPARPRRAQAASSRSPQQPAPDGPPSNRPQKRFGGGEGCDGRGIACGCGDHPFSRPPSPLPGVAASSPAPPPLSL